MSRITGDSIATIYFEFIWTSSHAVHLERYLAENVSFTRDILPLGVKSRMRGLGEGDSVQLAMDLTEVPPFKPGKVLDMPAYRFAGPPDADRKPRPRIGRFYPKYYIDNVPGTRPDSHSPFRITAVDSASFKANLNHPMADREVNIKATVVSIKDAANERGELRRWPDLFLNGPGMQARLPETPTDFLGQDPFRRKDETGDATYFPGGTTDYVGDEAGERVRSIYSEFLENGMDILDLMAGSDSRLPVTCDPDSVFGLGLDTKGMADNPALTKTSVQDLNDDPGLPFDDASFDAVLCTAGVEYLTSPFEIVDEAARVLRPGGVCAFAFTDRWDDNKVIGIWPELYPFERMGLVSQYLIRSEQFDTIHTVSDRGTDSDTIFTVWARRAAK